VENLDSPYTDAVTGTVYFRGTPGETKLGDVPIIDIVDEFSHAWGLQNSSLIGATARRGAPYYRFHLEVFGRSSMLRRLSNAEAEALQWAEIQMMNSLKSLE